MTFEEVGIKSVRSFIEEHHYSHSINGCKVSHCFALFDGFEIKAAVLFGPLSTTAWKKYGESEKDVIELRRLVCLDELPRNTESWLIAQCLKQLKGKYKVCVSYADPRHGHCGFIYQASNWSYVGQTANDIIYITPDGREYHSRALRTKHKGEYKPFVKRLREMKDAGTLKEIIIPGKYIYLYTLNGKQKRNGIEYPKVPTTFSSRAKGSVNATAECGLPLSVSGAAIQAKAKTGTTGSLCKLKGDL